MKAKFAGKWYEPEEVIDDDGENSSFYTFSNIETKHQPTENSNNEILRIFNKRKPYCPSDFKKQHFIDKLPKDI